MTLASPRSLLSLVLLVVMLASPRAMAASRSEVAAAEPDTHATKARRWYGWQTLAVDTSALFLMGYGLQKGNPTLTGIGATSYLVGPGIVHAAHGRVGSSAISVGMRLVLPPAVGAVGLGIGALFGLALSRRGDPLGNDLKMTVFGGLGAVLGVATGYFGAVLVDGGVLAYDGPQATPPRTAHPKVRVVPTFDVGPQNRTVGLAGTF